MAAAAPCQAHGSSSRCAPPPRPHRRRSAANPGPARRRPPSEPAAKAEGQRDELTAQSADHSGPALRNNNSHGASAPPPRRPGSAAAAGAAGGEGRSRGRALRSESRLPRSHAHHARHPHYPSLSLPAWAANRQKIHQANEREEHSLPRRDEGHAAGSESHRISQHQMENPRPRYQWERQRPLTNNISSFILFLPLGPSQPQRAELLVAMVLVS